MKKDNSYYYNVETDLQLYPEAWAYIVFGGRNCGKTYSGLRYLKQNNIKFVYLKRTVEDVKALCIGNRLEQVKKERAFETVDMSPFKSLNRDYHWAVKAYSIMDGLGAFYESDQDGNPTGEVIGYILALSVVGKFKGFDLSDCDIILFDEFVPKIWERSFKKEGDSVLELYKTISRDREHRGKPALKLICFANADNAASPLTNTLEITDDIVDLTLSRKDYIYNKERELVIHKIKNSEGFKSIEEDSKIFKAMKGTSWAKAALDNDFGYNDFSCVGKEPIKNYKPLYIFLYNKKRYCVHINKRTGSYYITYSNNNLNLPIYDMEKESDQKLWYAERYFDLFDASRESRATFQTYTMYNVMINFKKFFQV